MKPSDKVWSVFISLVMLLALVSMATAAYDMKPQEKPPITAQLDASAAGVVLASSAGSNTLNRYCGPSRSTGFNQYRVKQTIFYAPRNYQVRIYEQRSFWGRGSARTVVSYCRGGLNGTWVGGY